jgi:hypothetical protein
MLTGIRHRAVLVLGYLLLAVVACGDTPFSPVSVSRYCRTCGAEVSEEASYAHLVAHSLKLTRVLALSRYPLWLEAQQSIL